MPSSLPAAFSVRQTVPLLSSLRSTSSPMSVMLFSRQDPAVRHRLSRSVLSETMNDVEAKYPCPHDEMNETSSAVKGLVHDHQPQPIISKLVRGMPAESVLLLNVVAVIWGSQHPVIKMVVDDCDPSVFSLVRFAFAAVIASFFSWNTTLEKGDMQQTWRWGAEMGFWMFLGYAFQAIGLESTTAQRSGFLLYLNVKFVPFFARILFGRQISIPTWVTAFVAVFGTALLAYDPSHSSLDLNVGDAWSIAAAASSAMFILRLEAATKAVSNSAALNAACLWVVTGSSLLWTLGQGMFEASSIAYTFPHVWDNILYTMQSHPIELVYLSAVTTALANYIQTRAQRNVSAERASVIYAMDPAYGAFFSFWLLGERLTSTGIVGASLITLAAATSAFLDFGKSQEEESSDLLL